MNVLACQLMQDAFGNQRAFPALSDPAKGANPRLLQQTGGRLAFGRYIDFPSWERARETQELSWRVPNGKPDSLAKDWRLPQGILPVLRVRGASAKIVHSDQIWQAEDKILFLTTLPVAAAETALHEAVSQAG